MDTLRLGTFGLSIPFLVGIHKGHFSAAGIQLDAARVTSSREQFRAFDAGDYDLLLTAFDNVANYALNPHNALGRTIDICAVFPLDAGMNLTLVGAPGISGIRDLRGRSVAVDAADSGFAYVLYALLEAGGLRLDDVDIVLHGGVSERFDRLRAGESAATLLSNGLEVNAVNAGLRALAASSRVVDPYLGSVVAASRDWLAANRELGERFRGAYEQALASVSDPLNHDEVCMIVAEARSTTTAVAHALLMAELGSLGLALSTEEFDISAARNTLALRASYDGFEGEVDIAALSEEGSALYA